ncbi:MAG: addiction module antitoxin RelB [Opitutus sp.]|nr:addiction module antitoxin RelB [Opitutus sp.]
MRAGPMALILDQIVAEARQLPREQTAEIFDRLLAETIDTPDAEIEQAWKIETRRRIAEIENGTEPLPRTVPLRCHLPRPA